MKKRYFYCLIIFLFILIGSSNVPHAYKKVVNRLNTYQQLFPSEKVYLHLNKDLYTVGETIWFKAYLRDASTHKKDTLSSTLYVELINSDLKEVVSRKMLRVTDGAARGEFLLADSLPSSGYQLRAYTNWMCNFDPDFFYTKEVPVYNYNGIYSEPKLTSRLERHEGVDSVYLHFDWDKKTPAERTFDYIIKAGDEKTIRTGKVKLGTTGSFLLDFGIAPDNLTRIFYVTISDSTYTKKFSTYLNDQLNVQFFPEGGEMVEGLFNTVAFEATDHSGNPWSLEGILMDQDSASVVPVRSMHDGKGIVTFKHGIGKEYFLKVKHGEDWLLYPLPKAKTEGILMSAINSYGKDLSLIFLKNDPFGKYQGPFSLVGQVRGRAYLATQFDLSKTSSSLKIPKSLFPQVLYS